MKLFRSLLLLGAVGLMLSAFPPTAKAGVSFEYFYENLSPYGEWMDVGDYGYCWHPTGVDEDWRPYSDGYWAYTDEGWTWVSYEDFGSITYHYGRWSQVKRVGWVWRPDYEWAPAWVSWRHGGGHVGWAPLPFECEWRPRRGISIWVDSYYDIGPDHYNFVPVASFGSPYLRPLIVDRSRNVTIVNNTVNITNITVNNNQVYTGGPQYSVMAAQSRKPIPTLRLERVAAADALGRPQLATVAGGRLRVQAPVIEAPASGAGLKPAKLAARIEQPKVEKGWDSTKIDPAEKTKLQAKMRSETKDATPDSHPAKAIAAADVKVVEKKSRSLENQPPPAVAVRGKKGTTDGVPTIAAPVENSTAKASKIKQPVATPPPNQTPEKPKTGRGRTPDAVDPGAVPVEKPVGKTGKGKLPPPVDAPNNDIKNEREKLKKKPAVDAPVKVPAETEKPKRGRTVEPPKGEEVRTKPVRPEPVERPKKEVERPRKEVERPKVTVPEKPEVRRRQPEEPVHQEKRVVERPQPPRPPAAAPARPAPPASDKGKDKDKDKDKHGGKPTPLPPQ